MKMYLTPHLHIEDNPPTITCSVLNKSTLQRFNVSQELHPSIYDELEKSTET